MKILFIIYIIIFYCSFKASSQSSIIKTIVDDETGIPIIGVHIYKVDQLKTGTISNENGRFVLKRITKNDILEVSHISYFTFTGTAGMILSDTIRLSKKMIELDEIVINGESGRAIMRRVIDSLSANHSIEPVMYEVFARVLKYEENYSELHILSEYLFYVYQNDRHNSEFQIIQTRANSFSSAGEKYIKDMRMIQAISIYTDNIFKYKYDIFKHKKIKFYDIVIDNTSSTDHNLLKLVCTPNSKKVSYSFTLFIEKSSYAVRKIVNYYPSSINTTLKDEIGFKKINEKWYLDYSKIKRPSSIFSKWKPKSKAIYERLVIYNVTKQAEYDNNTFKTAFHSIAEPIKWHVGDWTDDFWENYNYIPLPEWVREKIDNPKLIIEE